MHAAEKGSDDLGAHEEVDPALAWQRFTEAVHDPFELFRHSPKEILAYLRPFLTNPERHQDHVEMIVDAAATSRVLHLMMSFPGTSLTLKLARKMPGGEKSRRALLERLNLLGEALSSTVQPASVVIDMLPARRLETDETWRSEGRSLMMMQVKLGVQPHAALEPASLSLTLSIEDPDVKFVDHFPKSEFDELGTREVAATRDGRFTSSIATSGKAGLQVGAEGAKLSAGVAASGSSEVQSGFTESETFTYKPKVRKVMSHAVGNEAHWALMASPPDSPTGGLDFLSTALVGGPSRAAPCTIDVGLRFRGWGELQLKRAVDLPVAGAESD